LQSFVALISDPSASSGMQVVKDLLFVGGTGQLCVFNTTTFKQVGRGHQPSTPIFRMFMFRMIRTLLTHAGTPVLNARACLTLPYV
jgi:hypothetical protein